MTYKVESFYRALLPQGLTGIIGTTTVRVSEVPNFLSGLLTVSPNTSKEEIVEYTSYDSTNKTLTISKRGINPHATSLTTEGVDYNIPEYTFEHDTLSVISGDINNIHINQSVSIEELNSNLSGKGASQIGIEDLGNYFVSNNVEGALQEAVSILAPNIKATSFAYGVSKLNIEPAVAGDPIVVGANDIRLTNDRYPLAHSHSQYNTFDATVGVGGTYNTINDAFLDGKRNIFLKPGTHNITSIDLFGTSLFIQGSGIDSIINYNGNSYIFNNGTLNINNATIVFNTSNSSFIFGSSTLHSINDCVISLYSNGISDSNLTGKFFNCIINTNTNNIFVIGRNNQDLFNSCTINANSNIVKLGGSFKNCFFNQIDLINYLNSSIENSEILLSSTAAFTYSVENISNCRITGTVTGNPTFNINYGVNNKFLVNGLILTIGSSFIGNYASGLKTFNANGRITGNYISLQGITNIMEIGGLTCISGNTLSVTDYINVNGSNVVITGNSITSSPDINLGTNNYCSITGNSWTSLGGNVIFGSPTTLNIVNANTRCGSSGTVGTNLFTNNLS